MIYNCNCGYSTKNKLCINKHISLKNHKIIPFIIPRRC